MFDVSCPHGAFALASPRQGPARDHGGLTFKAKRQVMLSREVSVNKIKLYPGPYVHTLKASVGGGLGQKQTGKSFRRQLKRFADGVDRMRDGQTNGDVDLGGGRAELRSCPRIMRNQMESYDTTCKGFNVRLCVKPIGDRIPVEVGSEFAGGETIIDQVGPHMDTPAL